MSYDFMAETNAFCKKVKVDRPKDWPDLNLDLIGAKCGGINHYEYKMIMNTCKTDQVAIMAIRNKRQSDADFDDYMSEMCTEKRRNRYVRKKTNDLEEDIEDKCNPPKVWINK